MRPIIHVLVGMLNGNQDMMPRYPSLEHIKIQKKFYPSKVYSGREVKSNTKLNLHHQVHSLNLLCVDMWVVVISVVVVVVVVIVFDELIPSVVIKEKYEVGTVR